MSQDKKDIQAQIDQLDSEWAVRCKAFEVRQLFRKELPRKEVSSLQELYAFVVLPLMVVAVIGVLALDYWRAENDLFSWFKKEWELCLGLVVLAVPCFSFSRYTKKADAYFQENKAYLSRRDELQAKLDALD